MTKYGILFLVSLLSMAAATSAYALPDWKGKQRALVLLLEWNDEKAQVSRQVVEDTFFGQGTSSLREFFLENSNGAFDLTGDVKDWRRTKINWTRFYSWDGCAPRKIWKDAWKEFEHDVKISDYDSDGDGKIDNLFIVHSGRIRKDRTGPDCVFDYGETKIANHTVVFQSQGLGSVGNQIPIGFYIHEAGHGYYGLGDYYGKHTEGKYGIGMWGMMGLGAWGTNNQIPLSDLFRYPAHFEPASKDRIGWVKAREITDDTMRIQLRPIETSGDYLKIPTGNKYTTYFVEYRSPQGFSKGHRGHGVLIWKGWELIQADGRDDLNNGRRLGRRPLPPINENFGDEGDPFPGSTNRTWYVDEKLGILFENIRLHDGVAELDVRFLGRHPRPSAVQLPILPDSILHLREQL